MSDELASVHLTLYNPKMVGQESKKLDPKAWSQFHRDVRATVEANGGEIVGMWLSAINAPQQSIIIKMEFPGDLADTIRDAVEDHVLGVLIPTSWLQGEETFFI
jgi:hypothetical protein